MKAIILLALATTALAGCQSTDYAMSNYGKVTPTRYVILPDSGPRFVQSSSTKTTQDRAKTYMVYDKPDESRLLITASSSDAAVTGFTAGMAGGAIRTDAPAVVYRDAAEKWLGSHQRTCRTDDVTEVMQTIYEVRYSCHAEQPKM